ncbi:hypothetical protein [Streptomyces sp. NRRL S-146]|uniref:hypothetical protein n=1 Tax=Streptomyces sp. NRRL S-146 TaxID=1463884 RepID=UPI00131B3B40|nr:hypothetical protein [Streptomyces sp. NRRL S-146]
MSNLEAVVALISGLGGASIGAVGAMLVQRSASKQQVAAAERARATAVMQAKRDRDEQSRAMAAEALGAARATARLWLLLVERTAQDFQDGRTLNAEALDSELDQLQRDFVSAIYRAGSFRRGDVGTASPPALGILYRPYVEKFAQAAAPARVEILSMSSGTASSSTVQAMVLQVRSTQQMINALLIKHIEDLNREPMSLALHGPSTPYR